MVYFCISQLHLHGCLQNWHQSLYRVLTGTCSFITRATNTLFHLMNHAFQEKKKPLALHVNFLALLANAAFVAEKATLAVVFEVLVAPQTLETVLAADTVAWVTAEA